MVPPTDRSARTTGVAPDEEASLIDKTIGFVRRRPIASAAAAIALFSVRKTPIGWAAMALGRRAAKAGLLSLAADRALGLLGGRRGSGVGRRGSR